ncbi:MAG: protein translocase subunit SecF, partial [Veillonella sp.]|nr:protein translocase subunit SecF [Veillonella sp.]
MSFNVIRHHRWWFVISSILVIISLISIFTKGFNFGIDYTGGTIVEVQFTKPVEV